MKSIKSPLAILKILALTLGLTLSLSSVGWTRETIRIGYFPQIHDAATFALRKALGKKYKLDYVRFLRYTDAAIALSRNDIQLSQLGYTSAVTGALQSSHPAFVYVAGMSRGAINVVCRKDVLIKTWQDLKGKTFGVLTGGPAELFFDDALHVHGLSPQDVKAVDFTAPGPPLLQALQNGTIQCTAVYEPFAATAVASGTAYYPPVNLAENSFFGINGGMAINAKFLKSHPKFVQDVVNTVVQSTALYNHDQPALISDIENSAIAGEFKTNVIKLSASHVILDSNLYLASLYKLATSMKVLGFVTKLPSDKALAAYYDYRFLEKATRKTPDELGRNR